MLDTYCLQFLIMKLEAATSSVSVSAQFYSNPFWILHDLSLVTFRLVNDSITCTEVVQVPKSSN